MFIDMIEMRFEFLLYTFDYDFSFMTTVQLCELYLTLDGNDLFLVSPKCGFVG